MIMRRNLRTPLHFPNEFSGEKLVLNVIAGLAKVLLICGIVFAVTMFVLIDPLGVAAPHSKTPPRETTQLLPQ